MVNLVATGYNLMENGQKLTHKPLSNRNRLGNEQGYKGVVFLNRLALYISTSTEACDLYSCKRKISPQLRFYLPQDKAIENITYTQ
ncbi:hypothetical protein KUTeg_004079 [Tegillarca granosa]|uniref:Uncharacterized protein n=1 Tax=Tegillarca granosa TaxID=220873 RepID=A0ABQ9FTF8_TEGGR|nr:hypothetical protein KUTeg_004079 [Tegillarca granosa]